MKYIYSLLIALALLGCKSIETKEEIGYELGYVIDGDTLYFSKLGSVRLSSIDTPESYAGKRMDYQADNCTNGDTTIIEEMGNRSTYFVESLLIPGDRYIVNSFGKDRYNRVVGEVLVKNKSLNIKIVREGYAVPYIFTEDINSTEVINAMNEARENKRGLWLDYYNEMNCLEALDRRS